MSNKEIKKTLREMNKAFDESQTFAKYRKKIGRIYMESSLPLDVLRKITNYVCPI